ncbi:MAG TPA: hypothetical protein P5024_12635 [Burkholderiaceae bacterium]|jgi:vacuolar-type H+-ATPase subunit F/Vma7|nr:hypothetical protein [Burkholderiaceae bacterium]HRZ02398.1 hypothetical protein [Burkholderiaceae bacterium]
MNLPVYIGDEVSAAAYRLAGLAVRVPAPGEEAEALALARRSAPLVLMSAATAAAVPAEALRAALAALAPVTVIVPDVHERVPLPDSTARLRRELGVEA